MRKYLWAACALAGFGAIMLAGQDAAPRSVYTAAQAAAGRTAFEDTCVKCHTGKFLRRTGEAGELPPVDALPKVMQDVVRAAGGQVPPLAGSDFMREWGGRTTSELANRIAQAVGGFKPQGADQATYLAITAYILQANGAKAGTQPLTAATAVGISSLAGR